MTCGLSRIKAPITKVTHSAARNITKYLNAVSIGFIVFGSVSTKVIKKSDNTNIKQKKGDIFYLIPIFGVWL
jgi:hypothetical protein